eukprot:c20214_g1_i1 orf=824-1033(+)
MSILIHPLPPDPKECRGAEHLPCGSPDPKECRGAEHLPCGSPDPHTRVKSHLGRQTWGLLTRQNFIYRV